MKISVSLPQVDVEFLDDYAHQHGIKTRSGALQLAVNRLRHDELGDAYEQAWDEWTDSGEDTAWDARWATGSAEREARRDLADRPGADPGAEANKRRPAVIVSNDQANRRAVSSAAASSPSSR